MTKLLTPDTAKNVFSHPLSHSFFAKGGTKYISTGSLSKENANEISRANGLDIQSPRKTVKDVLLSGKKISGASMEATDAQKALKMVEKAEQQISYNQVMEKMARNSTRSY